MLRAVAFVTITTVASGLAGLFAAGLVHWLAHPLSPSQFLVSALGFALFGLVASAIEVGPSGLRNRAARALQNRALTRREKALWLVVVALVVGIVFFVPAPR